MNLEYTMMRQFADSWGLVAMAAFFVCAVVLALRPSAKALYDDAAAIPFKENE